MNHAPKKPVPVFPLPDLVLFPCAVVELHVFELRYLAMVREALSTDRLIAIALLQHGGDRDHGSTEHHPIGCLGRIDAVTWRPNDSYDMRVRGLSRVRIQRPAREYPYRCACVVPVPQEPLDDDDPLIQMERMALDESYRRIRSWTESFALQGGGRSLSFEAYVNSVCHELPLSPPEKLELLELDSVLARSRLARERMDKVVLRPEPRREGERN